MNADNASCAECAERTAIVAEAVARLRARGVEPRPAVLALYARYAYGELSRQQVQEAMWERAAVLQAKVNHVRAHHCGRASPTALHSHG